MSSITKSIQKEYVLLMENAFSEKYKSAFRNLELKELRRFILKEIISSPELDNQLTNLIVLLNKFWDTHAAALITEIRASKSYRLLLPIQRFQKILTNKELLKKLLDNFNNIEKEVWVYDTDLKSFTTREVDLLDYDLPSAIATLLGKVEGAIYAQRSTQLSATLLAIKNSKKKKISSGLIFAGTATLGIASLAMPQLTLLSAAATGIGLAFGGKSLADIFSEHKAHKNEIQILEKTPVSLLYGAYKKK
ncbi:hypothetical protein MM452_000164 [Salmonella enterica]|uniref:hypothetical protein n=1 Tax=Salmonella enterica TaxID=28901 RepID=UPI001493EC7C|nr:hypothetical protein [Salmonella enterica]EDU6434519.1 hypothetical protein [Salmonella enterica subsp. salamae serovar 47:b:e,n,x,z15]EEJ7692304.1 hypothetical protein [Salmonella enterica]EHK2377490.1 hypothetical protein [Salmonella enterica]EIS9088142.1 hypothetical protein [Salmonella enterica]EIT5537198.1 hypothetical protein [Salmonella enterica]